MPALAKRLGLAIMAAALIGAASAQAQTSDLVSQSAFRVCADPANYPMSDREGRGFENRLAELFAAKLELPLTYEWFPMATGFVRQTLRAKKCDVIIGYAQGHELVLNTNHYLVSAYTIIAPQDSDLASVDTLSDPRLKGKKIGVIAGSPPATHLARNGLIGSAEGYHLFVDRRVVSPANDMLDDLVAGKIDAALLWGPLGGPLAKNDYEGSERHAASERTEPAPSLFPHHHGCASGRGYLEAQAQLAHPAQSGRDRSDPRGGRGAAHHRYGNRNQGSAVMRRLLALVLLCSLCQPRLRKSPSPMSIAANPIATAFRPPSPEQLS